MGNTGWRWTDSKFFNSFRNSLNVRQNNETSTCLGLICCRCCGVLAASYELVRVTINLKGINYVYFRYLISFSWRDLPCSVEKGSSYWAFALWRVVEVEIKVPVSMCSFPVNVGSNGSIGIPCRLRVKKCDRSVSVFFYSEFDVLVDGVKTGMELCEVTA